MGGGWPRQRLRAPSSCRPPGPRSCQLARYPRTTPPFRRPLRPSCDAVFAPIPTKSGASRASGWILGSWERRRPGPAHRGQRRTRPPAAGTRSRPVTSEDCGSDCGSGVSNWARTATGFESPAQSTELDKIFDQALILWCGMVTCGRAEIPVLGRDMGALGFKFPTTHRAYGGAGSELRRAEGGMVRSSEGTQRRSFSSLG